MQLSYIILTIYCLSILLFFYGFSQLNLLINYLKKIKKKLTNQYNLILQYLRNPCSYDSIAYFFNEKYVVERLLNTIAEWIIKDKLEFFGR
jgi:hypothetical protein